jgi:hypothetical protein
MKNKKTIILSVILFTVIVFPLAAAAKTEWQGLLEDNNIPSSYWKKYLPSVNQDECHSAVSSYLKSNPDSDIKTSICDDDNIIEGKYPLPDSSGKIAIEQHLWLANGQSASNHYSMTGTSKSCQNGMAGGYGAFGTLGKSDRQEEKYYITMRWEYADWTEPASTLSSSLGKADVSLTLKDTSEFPKSGYIKIGSEYLHYSSKSANKIKGLQRGYRSSASSHNKGDSVRLVYRYHGGNWERVTRALDIDTKKRDWYKEKKVLVTNSRNDKQVVASILEAGPAIWTGRVGGLSPEAFQAIKAKNNEKCTFQYVDKDTKLGPVK